MTESCAISFRPETESTTPSLRALARQTEPEGRRVLLVDPMHRLPQPALTTAVRESGAGRLTTARNLIDAMRYVISARPPVVIASWSPLLPELLTVLAEFCAPGGFPQIVVAARCQADYDVAVGRCECFPVIVVREEQLVRYLVQRLGTPQGG